MKNTMTKNVEIPNFWRIKPQPEPQKFTDMELALMEGGHSLPDPKYTFIKSLKEPTLGPLS